jgi:hypothetical protein
MGAKLRWRPLMEATRVKLEVAGHHVTGYEASRLPAPFHAAFSISWM